MAMNWMLPARAAQAVLSIVVLGLMAYVSSWWSSHWRQSSPIEINYLIFAPAWSLLTLAPLMLISLGKFAHLAEQTAMKWTLLGIEGMTMLFWLSGFVSLGVFLNGRICFGMVCDVARASTALSAVSWFAWMATFGLSVMAVIKGRKTGAASAGKKPYGNEIKMHQGV
ncbi:hypothetical protein J3E72DRAFT_388592 [Bipolaris maydis]|nr:hypothetical protein J3E73DRAFT_426160 [Bipolaris maydis]KAJ5056112.1 hypothetical protein J3E74DRAFT_280340 [Bipolaris maydis]KAJ6193861.1 hypothetical protein J3E72DRAFT_388592 [Bipolaris maydis]KAJ6267073.1 hypothetical protein PSV08DRAFT_404811 [Bipolaris maydis]KAJ6277690.1 hypothetical protein J3E71DRAFT_402732 [Bipolaris maydis]